MRHGLYLQPFLYGVRRIVSEDSIDAIALPNSLSLESLYAVDAVFYETYQQLYRIFRKIFSYFRSVKYIP